MHCDESKNCPAKASPCIPCWEIAKEASDYRHVMLICADCIVRMLKDENCYLSKNEIQSIMVNKANCVLTSDDCWDTY
jgi:hypothetical protein